MPQHYEKFIKFIKEFTLKEEGPGKGASTQVDRVKIGDQEVSRFINEFWTSKQRQASSLHEISYRACFKPQLPRFFINLFTQKGERVYDPFSGRGTTLIEAGMLGRDIVSNDINPLSQILTAPRLTPPSLEEVEKRLDMIPVDITARGEIDLSMFYHPATEGELVSIRNYLLERSSQEEDPVDMWIRMVATNRLTGHSPGFFSVYTLPPNQAVTPERQVKINHDREQEPPYRDTKELILKKTRSLLRNLKDLEIKNLRRASQGAIFLSEDARSTRAIEDESIHLTVTSPPFLDVVQYHQDNWLRCWFNNINSEELATRITMAKTIGEWTQVMEGVLAELYRITAPGGWVAFEVGDLRGGKINLDEYIVPLGCDQGFSCIGILINLQEFTKTSNIWGIKNNKYGTNTNRIAIFVKE